MQVEIKRTICAGNKTTADVILVEAKKQDKK